MKVPKEKAVVFVRPIYDELTAIVSEWAEDVIQHAKKSGYEVIDIKASEAIRRKVEATLASRDPKFFFHYGHGKDDALLGQNGVTLIDLENVSLLRNRITYAVCCHSGSKLGQEIAKIGQSWFAGWKSKFVLPPAYVKSRHLLPFKDSVNSFAIAILDRKTVKEAYAKAISTWDKWAECYENKMWRDYRESTRILYEIETANVPEDYIEIHKHFKNAYKLRVLSLTLQIFSVETLKDEEMKTLLSDGNPCNYAAKALREIGNREIRTAGELLRKKRSSENCDARVWTLKDLF
jgi:hypothetical protein